MNEIELTRIFDNIMKGIEQDGWAGKRHHDKDTLTRHDHRIWERDIDPNGPWMEVPPMSR